MIAVCAIFTAMAVTAIQAVAQKDEGPILRPKKPAPATLLVTCDLACNWKLDGEAKGLLDAGGSAKARVQLGEHLVIAATEDGLDQAQQIVKVQEKGQLVVAIGLKSVRDARQRAEQDQQEKAAQEQQERDRLAQEQATREQQERDRQARAQAAQEELDRLIWIDPATKLMWTKKDNGFDVTAQDAFNYCRGLQLAGYSDWQLPGIDQLAAIIDLGNGESLCREHAKGNLQISGFEWGLITKKNRLVPLSFNFCDGSQWEGVGASHYRALCVRRSGE
jgi:hypothetical protein